MAKVLKADGSADPTAYVEADFASTDEVWVTLDVGFSQDSMDLWASTDNESTTSGQFVRLSGDEVFMYFSGAGGSPAPTWTVLGNTVAYGTITSPEPTGDTFHTVEIHWNRSTLVEIFVDSVSIFTDVATNFPIADIRVGAGGAWSFPLDPLQVIYIDNVKVGTTRGGTDLFADDFEDGTTDAWASSVGAISVIDTPTLGGPPTGEPPQDETNVTIAVAPGVEVLWLVKLFNADGSGDPNAKHHVATVQPEKLHFLKNIGRLGPHEIDFEISLGALDRDGRRAVSPAFIGPYRSDWELWRTDLAKPVMNGMVTLYGGAEAGDEHVKVAGKSYLHYLERRCWPYDATLSYVNWPDGFRFKVRDADVGRIVKDILETVRDVSPSWPAPGTSYSLDYTVNVDATGKTINYEIGTFESQSIYEIVRTLAEARVGDGGFDFIMTVGKVFRLVVPEIGSPSNPVLELQIDAETALANMLSVAQTNTGPDATHVLGTGAGTANRAGGVNKHFRSNSGIFRRLDKVEDFGDVKNLDELETLTSEALSYGAYPIHEVPVIVDPNDHPGFWARVTPGVYIAVRYDLGYARLPNEDGFPQKLVSMECDVDLEGNEQVVLGLTPRHELADDAGLADP